MLQIGISLIFSRHFQTIKFVLKQFLVFTHNKITHHFVFIFLLLFKSFSRGERKDKINFHYLLCINKDFTTFNKTNCLRSFSLVYQIGSDTIYFCYYYYYYYY